MKRILAIMIAVGLALGASAQTKIRGQVPTVNSGGNGGKQKVIVVAPRPYNPFYSPYYGYSRWGYDPFGYNPYYFGWRQDRVSVPTKLDLEIEQIKSDYHHQIATVRHDKSISKSERKQAIRDLKHEREDAIIDAKKDYYEARTDRR